MLTPEAFFRKYVGKLEGGLSLDTRDKGNWHNGQLVGSKFGVTGDALAKHRKVHSVTRADMVALTADEAVAVGLDGYYRQPGFNKLPWDRVVMSAVDHGYNRGQAKGVKALQRVVGTVADGQLGNKTVEAYEVMKGRIGEANLAIAFTKERIRDYKSLHNPIYEQGWINRANKFKAPDGEIWRATA